MSSFSKALHQSPATAPSSRLPMPIDAWTERVRVLVAADGERWRAAALRAIRADPRFRAESCTGKVDDFFGLLAGGGFEVAVLPGLGALRGRRFTTLQGGDGCPEIVIVSGERAEAPAAFDLGVCDFVAQPFAPERLQLALRRAASRSRLRRRQAALPPVDRLVSRSRNCIELIRLDDVQAIQSCDGKLWLHMSAGPRRFSGTIASLAGVLPSPPFLLVHRGYLLNLDHVASWRKAAGGLTVTLTCGRTVPVALRHQPRFRTLVQAQAIPRVTIGACEGGRARPP